MSNMETLTKIEEELFTPALQKGFKQAKEAGYRKEDALVAVANAYMNMLLPILGGKEATLAFLKNQVRFLESQKE
jgi:hypothetical protein